MSILLSNKINSLVKEKEYSKLEELISSSKGTTRYKIFLSLSAYKDDPQIKKLLTPLLNDSNYRVRTLAMAKFTDFKGKEKLDKLDKVLKLGSRAEKIEILRIVSNHSENLRDDLTAFVITALSDKHDSVVIEALKLASKLKNPIIFETIVAKLKTEKHPIRCEIAKTLGIFGDERSIDILMSLLADKNYQVRLIAEETLTQLRSPKILKSIYDSKFDILAAKLSGTMQIKLKTLKEIQKSNLDFTIPLVEKLLFDKYKAVRAEALKTLGILNKPETIPLIAKLLEDRFWDIRKEAVLALGKFAEKKALEYLEIALNDKNTNVRNTAAEKIESVKVRLARLKR